MVVGINVTCKDFLSSLVEVSRNEDLLEAVMEVLTNSFLDDVMNGLRVDSALEYFLGNFNVGEGHRHVGLTRKDEREVKRRIVVELLVRVEWDRTRTGGRFVLLGGLAVLLDGISHGRRKRKVKIGRDNLLVPTQTTLYWTKAIGLLREKEQPT
jgi:hypothetical protein